MAIPYGERPYSIKGCQIAPQSWWRHQMETYSVLLAISAGNSPVTGEFPAQRSVTRNFDVFFDQRLNKRLNKQSWGWWFETPPCPLWHHCNIESISLTVNGISLQAIMFVWPWCLLWLFLVPSVAAIRLLPPWLTECTPFSNFLINVTMRCRPKY